MSEEENLESKDQPVKESDQPEVDSNDEEDNLDEDQPQAEESDEEESIPQEELKAGYMRQSDYTKKTQELAEMRKEIEALKKQTTVKPKAKLSPEYEKARQTMRSLGFLSKEDMAEEFRRMGAKKEMASDAKRLSVSEDIIGAARHLQASKGMKGETISIDDAVNILAQGARTKKVVKRKSVGAKGGVASAPKNASNQIELSEFRKLDPTSDKYSKVIKDWRAGKLKIINN